MSLQEFLLWLANSGGSILAVSWLLEQWKWYQAKSADMKRSLFFVFSLLVTMSAYSVLTYVPVDALNARWTIFPDALYIF